jgi:hypothetical protein
MNAFRLAAVACIAIGIASIASAHHSVSGEFNAHDSDLYSVSGTLTKVEWVNPHIYFTVESKGADGVVTTYRFENYPPAFWQRQGVGRSAFKVGDAMTIEAYPARDGTKTLGWAKVIHFADGRTIATMTAEQAANGAK